jgi:hypothetical protein
MNERDEIRGATRRWRGGRMARAMTFALTSAMLASCRLSSEGCGSAEPITVSLTVVESVSGARITGTASAILIGMSSTDTIAVNNGRGSSTVELAEEGSFTLRIIAAGYELWERSDVVIARSAVCSVSHAVAIDARLTSTPSSSIATP